MSGRALLAGLLVLVACKKAAAPGAGGSGSGSAIAVGSGSGSGSAGSAATPVESFTAEASPIKLLCGDAAAPVPPAPATTALPPAKPLAKARAIAGCRDRASPQDLCACLVDQVKVWGKDHDVVKPVECSPRDQDDRGGVFEVRRTGDEVRGGAALVFGAKHGDKWSAITAIDSAEAIDPEEQPKASTTLKVVEFAPHPIGASTMYWIATRDETEEKTTGEMDRSGVAHGTVCMSGARVGDAAAPAADACFEPVVLAAWNYSYPVFDDKGTCTVSSIETYKATLSNAQLRVELSGGKADAGASAIYALDLAATPSVPGPASPAAPTLGKPPADDGGDVPFGKSDECVAIVTKIKECQNDAAFANALDKGADAKRNVKLRKQIGEWPKPWPTCDTYFSFTFEHVGFLKDPDVLIDDHVLDTCATLGTAIREAGGLPGGDIAK